MNPRSFKQILSPCTEADFPGKIVGQSVAWFEGGPDRFSNLVSWRTVNDLLTFSALTFPRLRLSKGGKDLPEDLYFKKSKEGFARLIVGQVNALLRGGAMVIIESVHELHPPLLDLCRDIEHTLMLPIRSSIVISCAEATNSGLQWNDYEMLVLQVRGTTRWRVWPATTSGLTPGGRPTEPTTEPLCSDVLKAGSLAYVPKGWWWCPETASGEASLQLVIAFRNPTGLDVIGRVVDQLQANEVMRRASPRFAASESQGHFIASIQAELARVLGEPGVLLGFEKDMWSMSEQLSYFSLPWSVSLELPDASQHVRVISLVRFLGSHSVFHLDNEDAVEVFHEGAIVRLTAQVGLVLLALDSSVDISLEEIFRRCQWQMPQAEVSAALIELAHRGLIGLLDIGNPAKTYSTDSAP